MDAIIILNEEQEAYVNRALEEEHLSFEDFSIVYALRRANERDAYWKSQGIKFKQTKEAERFKVGDRVWVSVHRVPKNKKWTLGTHEWAGGIVHTVHKDGTYDVTSAIAFFKHVTCQKRTVKDLSHIEVPTEVKKISTDRLLKAFKASQRNYWVEDEYFYGHVDVFINGITYKPEVIKAELNTREHIYSKQDIQLVKQYAK